MKRHLAGDINKRNKEINAQVKKACKKESDVGDNLLNNRNLTLQNVEELGRLIAEKYEYDVDRLIVCKLIELKQRLDSTFNNRDIVDNPIFVICHDGNGTKITFCIVESSEAIVCLYKDFANEGDVANSVQDVLTNYFDKKLRLKISADVGNDGDPKNRDILCLKTLETMMVNLKSNKKEAFIEGFDNPKTPFFQWLKDGATFLKSELFSLVKNGYYATIASDIDQLANDVEFKKAIKEFIDAIPLIEEANLFKNYQTLLKEFVEIDENDIDFESDRINHLQEKLERAKANAFGKVNKMNIDVTRNENGALLLDIQKKFPRQMEKFAKIFQPLIKSKADNKLDDVLKEISSKLDLDHTKLNNFFDIKDNIQQNDNGADRSVENIKRVIDALPKAESKSSDSDAHKPFDELLLETVVEQSESLNTESLRTSYTRIKDFHELWCNENARNINRWALSKKGKLHDSDIYEAIAVLDRANELATGGHRLRDTQILSLLTFLLQTDKGQLTQIQTGEGKTTIVSILAAIKALNGQKVDVVTSNPVLASDAIRDKRLFYDLLSLSVATNNLDETYKTGPRECYKANVVYGSISNFQFDYLKDSFLGLNTRAERPFEIIILDEVDSMIIDNASHIAKLSESLPGMDSLKYVYIKIWQELHKAERQIVVEFGNRSKTKAAEIQELSIADDEAQLLYEQFQNQLEDSTVEYIKNAIKQTNPTKIDLIPSHIREYADSSLDRWISSALDAKFVYKEDEQYVIRAKNNERVIQPVDYANTGMTLKNTIWQHGLHQFLQLKHNLRLTSENLTSCFISNLGYINIYGNRIFGLTGTLGSEAEQTLLSSIYNVGYAKIPTYKLKQFIEIDSLVVDDETFSTDIARDVADKVKDGRAVLIICETIKDAKSIGHALTRSNIVGNMFFDEENARITEKEVKRGDVVIATNIAGRGTDFKTSRELESNGGLHVCVAFLPCNQRVEDQAFGRTARQGNHGSAQLIIKTSEIEKLGIDLTYPIDEIKHVRDQKEKYRIQLIREIKIPELRFQDRLFELFSDLYRGLQKQFQYQREHKFVLDDLKEFWAFWLNKQQFEGAEIAKKHLESEFSNFKSEARKTIEGEIQFNPFYSIQQAEYFISSNEKLDDAERSLNHAIGISKNPEILHSAYLKLFEIAIERGRVFTDKCRKALGEVFFIPMIEPDRRYKQTAKKYLGLAKSAFRKELDYIDNLFKDEEFSNILKSDVDDNSIVAASDCDETQRENVFVNHIVSKQQALNLEMNHADSMVQLIDNNNEAGLSVGCRVPDYFSNLKANNSNEKTIKNIVKNSELAELAANGSNITYALKVVHDVCPEIAKAAQIQITGGIALIATGICFPPALPVTSSIGGTMITEGMCDIAVELVNQNSDGKFNRKAYVKGKVVSYGISLLTLGINAALQCPKILQKAKNACRWLASTLRKCPMLKGVCEYVAGHFDKLASWFEKLETIAKFNNMTKLQKLQYIERLEKSKDLNRLNHLGTNIKQYQELLRELQQVGELRELTRLQNCATVLRQTTVNVAKNLTVRTVEHAITGKIIMPILNSTMSGMKPIVKKHVEKSVKDNIDRDKLRHTCLEEVQRTIQEIKESIDYDTLNDIFKNTILGITKHCSNWKVQLGALAFEQCSSWAEIYNHAKYLCAEVNDKLKYDGKSTSGNVDQLIDRLIQLLTDEVYNQVLSATIKTCKDAYVVGKSMRANYKRDASERSKCLEINENFKNGGQAGQEQIKALSDDINCPIHIHDENGDVVIIGEHRPGNPVKISYFPPDSNNPYGHYVPFGEDRRWSGASNNINNCVFDAVGSQIGMNGDTLRQNTIDRIESNPTRYMAVHVRDTLGTDVLLEGGRSNEPILEDHYPSYDYRVKVALKHTSVLANLRNILNKHKQECDQFDSKSKSQKLRYMKQSKSMLQFGPVSGKEEMMMGSLVVKFTDGSQLKLVSISGDQAFFVRQSVSDQKDLNFTAKPIPFTWNSDDGFEFVDPGKPNGRTIYDVYNKRETNVTYTKSCAAQKLFYYVGEHMKANPNLEIDGHIDMAESWYKPGTGKYTPEQVIINKSCDFCVPVLPAATGKHFHNK